MAWSACKYCGRPILWFTKADGVRLPFDAVSDNTHDCSGAPKPAPARCDYEQGLVVSLCAWVASPGASEMPPVPARCFDYLGITYARYLGQRRRRGGPHAGDDAWLARTTTAYLTARYAALFVFVHQREIGVAVDRALKAAEEHAALLLQQYRARSPSADGAAKAWAEKQPQAACDRPIPLPNAEEDSSTWALTYPKAWRSSLLATRVRPEDEPEVRAFLGELEEAMAGHFGAKRAPNPAVRRRPRRR